MLLIFVGERRREHSSHVTLLQATNDKLERDKPWATTEIITKRVTSLIHVQHGPHSLASRVARSLSFLRVSFCITSL
jgi:hypothetical protein